MRQVSDHDLSLRNDAIKSFLLVLEFLRTLQLNQADFLTVIPDFKTLDLERYVPDENHKNLLLVFSPGKFGAKFSYREDKKFVITIFIDDVFNWKGEMPRKIADWFLKRRSSYVHEFVHYLDVKEIKDLETFSGVTQNNAVEYANNPIEIRGHLQQALHDFELDMEYKSGDRYKKLKQLEKTKGANTKENFVRTFKKLYFPYDFIVNLSKENERAIDKVLSDVYREVGAENKFVDSTTSDIVLEIFKIIVDSRPKDFK